MSSYSARSRINLRNSKRRIGISKLPLRFLTFLLQKFNNNSQWLAEPQSKVRATNSTLTVRRKRTAVMKTVSRMMEARQSKRRDLVQSRNNRAKHPEAEADLEGSLHHLQKMKGTNKAIKKRRSSQTQVKMVKTKKTKMMMEDRGRIVVSCAVRQAVSSAVKDAPMSPI